MLLPDLFVLLSLNVDWASFDTEVNDLVHVMSLAVSSNDSSGVVFAALNRSRPRITTKQTYLL